MIRFIATCFVVASMSLTGAVAFAQSEETPFGFPLHDHREQVVEATSLLGEPLLRLTLDDATRARLEANLDEAYAQWQAAPDEEMTWVWLGRRLGYLGRYNDAIAVYTAGIEEFPDSYRLRRHRGHRYISVRNFDRAIEDLSEAALIVMRDNIGDEIEPDGAPNAKNEPRSTTHSNIFYHLALAYYLKGDYRNAIIQWRRCLDYSDYNDDQRVSTGYWFYRTQRELGHAEQADAYLQSMLRTNMDVIENYAYLNALQEYFGGLEPVDPPGDMEEGAVYLATFGYAQAAEALADGDEARGLELLASIMALPDAWPAFGYIAAESRLAQMRNEDE